MKAPSAALVVLLASAACSHADAPPPAPPPRPAPTDRCDPPAAPSEVTSETLAALAACEEAAGRLVGALRYGRDGIVLALRTQDQARTREATQLVRRLLPRIPRLTLAPEGSDTDVRVTVDQQLVPGELVEARAFSVDPGDHEIEATATRDGRTVQAKLRVRLAEAERKTVGLKLD